MKKTSKSKKRATGVLPTKPLLADLERFRIACCEIVASYLIKVESDIAAIADLVASEPAKKTASASRVADMRDMLMLLRALELKPAKGRRRDLKKVENILEELAHIAERW